MDPSVISGLGASVAAIVTSVCWTIRSLSHQRRLGRRDTADLALRRYIFDQTQSVEVLHDLPALRQAEQVGLRIPGLGKALSASADTAGRKLAASE